MRHVAFLRPYSARVGIFHAPSLAAPSGMHRRASQPEPRELHVRPDARGWTVTQDASPRPLSAHESREHALALARSLARRARAVVVVYAADGTIEETRVETSSIISLAPPTDTNAASA